MKAEDFKKVFKGGDEVILIDSEEQFDWGFMEIVTGGIKITCKHGKALGGRREYIYPLDDIALIAHQGVKLKKLKANALKSEPIRIIELYPRNWVSEMLQFFNTVNHKQRHRVTMKERRILKNLADWLDAKPEVRVPLPQVINDGPLKVGDPWEIPFIDAEPLSDGILLHQPCEAKCIIMPETELFVFEGII